jgi:hypothetical protein
MIGRLWSRLATLIRPDSATLVSEVDFDPGTGRLTVLPTAEVHGQTIRVGIQALSTGRGKLGPRAFRISDEAISALVQATRAMRLSRPDTLICDDARVPEVIELLRGTPHVRFSRRADQVEARNAQLNVSRFQPTRPVLCTASAVRSWTRSGFRFVPPQTLGRCIGRALCSYVSQRSLGSFGIPSPPYRRRRLADTRMPYVASRAHSILHDHQGSRFRTRMPLKRCSNQPTILGQVN